MSKPSIIVVGPARCGKTRNAETLRRYFGLARVLDTGGDLRPTYHVPPNDTLVLATPDQTLRGHAGTRVVRFNEAMKMAQLRA